MTPSVADKVKRPVKYLSAISQRHTGIWKSVDLLRANREQIQQKYQWPSWCYLPLGGAAGIISPPIGTDQFSVMVEASRVAMLASWRHAKDIYIFDETVLDELWETPIDGDIPIEILHKLPTWCAYVAFPAPRDVEGGTAHGFFVNLNYSRMPVLLLAVDFGPIDRISPNSMMPFFVELHEGRSLLQSLTAVHQKAAAKNAKPSPATEAAVQPERVMRWVEPLLSLTIYLCSASAEIRARDPLRGLRGKAYTKKTKKGVRTFVPEEPQVWEVAFRIGATLRAAKAAVSQPNTDQGGTHASPRPHIRRAHWHSYWTGPKAAVGKPPAAREVIVKWIPPIPIAMGPDDETIPTVHRVTK